MIAHKQCSYRDLPIRYADFDVLHRNELGGALNGMIRVRRFCQDDSHIFCRPDQIGSEISNCLEFIQSVYAIFSFEFSLELSTRPDKCIGDIAVWDEAERMLKEALDKWGIPWQLNEGDGAFYGPKIDIHIKDALGRSHQCATVQLDFNLPSEDRFDLTYMDESGQKSGRMVMIHRAIYGSIERFFAILTEHYAGKWPYWLSPRQVIVVPVSEKYVNYANIVRQSIHDAGYYVDVDDSACTLGKKIRNAQTAMYNYILVVGQREVDDGTVNVRYRDSRDKKVVTVDELLAELADVVANYK